MRWVGLILTGNINWVSNIVNYIGFQEFPNIKIQYWNHETKYNIGSFEIPIMISSIPNIVLELRYQLMPTL